jgi:hypothetical protein
MSLADVDEKSNLIADRAKDLEPGPTLALAFLARGVLALLRIGMTPELIEKATRQFLGRYEGRGPTLIQRATSEDLRQIVKEVMAKALH